ncbi:hypothetical protein DS62_03535, partial [Smithella sp. SC_K08D17]
MIDFEEVKKYLPQYLSSKSQDKLFQELKSFPKNIDDRLYSQVLKKDGIVYQGDGINGMLVVNLPLEEIRPVRSMILSNSCSIHADNKKLSPSRIIYAPIFNLQKYVERLTEELKNEENFGTKIAEHIDSLKRQLNTQIFYLPKGGDLEDDSMVFLDRLNNCPTDYITSEEISKRKIFTLSDYGF